ncbi:halocyanin domain-containing protein [Halomicrobium mukohataei]|uniref:Halocyanin domain-containing protein n=1 Tax=Halomicrobium mukohataei TaxID=57705 RepID=A0A847UFX6_9EURY|nr:halocyanin domain-containing protein [Halomicrobium mukohataei]NLV11396.1 halocyanin domain-containing protein [Halomicrobium mukohataei]
MNRREFVRTAGGVAGASAAASATGAAVAQEEEGGDGGSSGGPPDYGDWLSSVSNFDGETVDATGQDSATVKVGTQANGGAFGFGPPAIHVDNGATVKFEWTGEGGRHNVVSEGEGPLDSGSAVETTGVEYEHTFEEDGIYPYYCSPHKSLNMKGAIVVGTDYATAGGGSGGEGGGVETLDPEEAGVPIQPHWVGIGAGLAMVVSTIFTFYLLKYGESANTKGGNN